MDNEERSAEEVEQRALETARRLMAGPAKEKRANFKRPSNRGRQTLAKAIPSGTKREKPTGEDL